MHAPTIPATDPPAMARTSRALSDELARRDNDYRPQRRQWESQTETAWSASAPSHAVAKPLSIVIPMRNRSALITKVLDDLRMSLDVDFEVIVVDDASSDDGAFKAAAHPLRPTVIRLGSPAGSSVARNAGTALARTETILFLDADMLVGTHLLYEFACRAREDLVLPGFRHHVPFHALSTGPLTITSPRLDADVRHTTTISPGILPFTGQLVDQPTVSNLLDNTNDLIDLGNGRNYFDWTLPRSVVTAMVAMPRSVIIDTGGFHPGFRGLWGAEDAYVVAKAIGAGCKVAPVRSAVAFHVDEATAVEETALKNTTLPRTVAFYNSLLAEPLPAAGASWFTEHTRSVLGSATTIHNRH
jgi:GT2 family glycosyltransferase